MKYPIPLSLFFLGCRLHLCFRGMEASDDNGEKWVTVLGASYQWNPAAELWSGVSQGRIPEKLNHLLHVFLPQLKQYPIQIIENPGTKKCLLIFEL